MVWKRIGLVILISVMMCGSVSATEQDVDGGEDHPLISRYAGSIMVGYEMIEFDEYVLALGGILKERVEDGDLIPKYAVTTGGFLNYRLMPSEHKMLEGRITKITYLAPVGRSTLEVFRNYEIELEKAGFEVLLSISGDSLNDYGTWYDKLDTERRIYGSFTRGHYMLFPDNPRYLAAKLSRPEGAIYIGLFIHQGGNVPRVHADHVKVQMDIIEVAGMEDGMVTFDAMYENLSRTGSVSIYGINFEFDSVHVMVDSWPVLNEIAQLLSNHPEIELFVVGHTDGIGRLEYNLNLSEQRANAVVDILVTEYGIEADRLISAGVGPLSPVASNLSEEGRKLNRRVELVMQTPPIYGVKKTDTQNMFSDIFESEDLVEEQHVSTHQESVIYEDTSLCISLSDILVPTGGEQIIQVKAKATYGPDHLPAASTRIEFFANTDHLDRRSQLSSTDVFTDDNGVAFVTYTTLEEDDNQHISILANLSSGDDWIHKNTYVLASNEASLVKGLIINPFDGKPYQNADISFYDINANKYLRFTDQSNQDGNYTIAVMPGKYYISIYLDLEETIPYSGTFSGSHFNINSDEIVSIVIEEAVEKNQIYVFDFEMGIVTGMTRNLTTGTNLFIVQHGTQRTSVAEVNATGRFLIALTPGTYNINLSGGHIIGNDIRIIKGNVTDVGTISR